MAAILSRPQCVKFKLGFIARSIFIFMLQEIMTFSSIRRNPAIPKVQLPSDRNFEPEQILTGGLSCAPDIWRSRSIYIAKKILLAGSHICCRPAIIWHWLQGSKETSKINLPITVPLRDISPKTNWTGIIQTSLSRFKEYLFRQTTVRSHILSTMIGSRNAHIAILYRV